jgi:hypothetical protein
MSPEIARRAVAEHVEHYHAERNHQGVGSRLIFGPSVSQMSNLCATSAAARRPLRLLSASRVIVRSAENWNMTAISDSCCTSGLGIQSGPPI